MGRNVRGSQQVFTFAKQIHRFIAKGGKSRETAQNTDKNQRAGLGRKNAMRFREVEKHSDKKTPENIDKKRPVGKPDTFR